MNTSNPQSFNRYAYVLNSPLMGVDPLGLDDFVCSSISYSVNAGYGDQNSGTDTTCLLIQTVDITAGVGFDGGGGGIAPGNGPQNVQNTIKNCAQAGQAAASSVPSATPSGQDVYEAGFGAAVGVGVAVVTAPEDGPMAPVVYKATSAGVTGMISGFFKTAMARTVQKWFTSAMTTQGCMVNAGVPFAATPGLY